MQKTKYVVGGVGFTTKEAIQKRCQQILQQYQFTQQVTGQDLDIVFHIYSMHPDKPQDKAIKHISVEKSRYKTLYFLVHYEDGTQDDFSYIKALEGKLMTPRQHFVEAARLIIGNQVNTFKKDVFRRGRVFCAVNGEELDWDSAHVDHFEPTFDEIIDRWISANPALIETLTYTHVKGLGKTLTDKSVETAFAKFHKKHANLRVVSAQWNLSQGAHNRKSKK